MFTLFTAQLNNGTTLANEATLATFGNPEAPSDLDSMNRAF